MSARPNFTLKVLKESMILRHLAWWVAYLVFLLVVIVFAIEAGTFFLNRSRFSDLIAWRQNDSLSPAEVGMTIRKFEVPTTLRQRKPIMENAPTTFGVDRMEKRFEFPGKVSATKVMQDGLRINNPGVHAMILYWTKTDEQIYSVKYTVDEFGRRIVQDAHRDRALAALFWGCSFTFGEAIEDTDTLPKYFEQYSKYFTAYNFGVRGYAPNEMIVQLRDGRTLGGIAQKSGVALYLFLDNHMSRSLGYLDNYSWTRTFANVDLDEHGKAIHNGTFASVHPLRDLWLRLLGLSETFRFFKLNWPLRVTDRDLDHFADLVQAMKFEMKEKFPGFQFVMVFHPMDSDRYGSHLIARLEKRGINYLDYSGVKWENLIGESGRIRVDGHPNGVSNRLLGQQLAEDLDRAFGDQIRN